MQHLVFANIKQRAELQLVSDLEIQIFWDKSRINKVAFQVWEKEKLNQQLKSGLEVKRARSCQARAKPKLLKTYPGKIEPFKSGSLLAIAFFILSSLSSKFYLP